MLRCTGTRTCALPSQEVQLPCQANWYALIGLRGPALTNVLTHWRNASRLAEQKLKLRCGYFPISEAVDEVVVHHADCLHMCVYNSGTHEAESAVFQVRAERIGFGRGGGNLLHHFPAVHFR